MLYIDGIGVALFGIEATHKAWALYFGRPLAPVILGVVTAIGGGHIRDTLAGRQTLFMNRELYATPVLVGCAIYVVALEHLPEYRSVSWIGCALCIFGLRAAAIHWNLILPAWLVTKPKTK
jgi:uncharacterized membrane protein YeiH